MTRRDLDNGGNETRPADPAFSLPEGWDWGELAKGLSHRKTLIRIEEENLYKRVTVQLHGRGIVLRDVIPGSRIKTKDQQVARANDFLVAEIDAKVGGFGIVPTELDGAVVSSHYFTFELKQEELIAGYLEMLIRVGFLTKGILQFVRGSLNYAAIRPRHVLAVRIPYPPIPVQHLIAQQVSVVDQVRKAAEVQLAAINALPGALLRRTFSGEL